MKKVAISTNTVIVLLFTLFYGVMQAQPNFVWAKQFTGTNYRSVSALAHDRSGNVYSSGSFTDTIDLDPGPGTYYLISPKGKTAHYISKLNALGGFIWGKQINQTTNYDYYCHIIVDSSGNLYLTSSFKDTIDCDPGPGVYYLTSKNDADDLFILKLDASGNFVWVKKCDGTYWNAPMGITLDPSGFICIAGEFGGTIDFDPGAGIYNLSVILPNRFDAFVLKLDTSGNFIWAKQMGGTSRDLARSIAVDIKGNGYCSPLKTITGLLLMAN
jgi:hypothetical protein